MVPSLYMKTYTYTIHLEPADEGGYTVTVPALPAIVTEGDTEAEAMANAREAIECYLESLVRHHRPIPLEARASRPIDARIQVKAPAAV